MTKIQNYKRILFRIYYSFSLESNATLLARSAKDAKLDFYDKLSKIK